MNAAERTTSRCRSCRAPIIWAQTENGKQMPLDAEPYDGDDPRGLFVFRHVDQVVYAMAVTPDAFPAEPVYRSHFATCPHAAEHRR
jgi:hypothetical protein